MVQIKSITDVITNSSSETFIYRRSKIPEGEEGQFFDWESILEGWCTNLSRDEMIIVLVVGLGETLGSSPFRVGEWDTTETDPEEVDKLWKEFVLQNEASFRKLLDLAYVEGEEDNCFSTTEEWEAYREEMQENALLWTGIGQDFCDKYGKVS